MLWPLPTPKQPWSHIVLDFVTGLPPSSGNTHILTLIDCFIKVFHFVASPKLPSALETAKSLTSSGFHPQTIGLAKWANQELEAVFRYVSSISDYSINWRKSKILPLNYEFQSISTTQLQLGNIRCLVIDDGLLASHFRMASAFLEPQQSRYWKRIWSNGKA